MRTPVRRLANQDRTTPSEEDTSMDAPEPIHPGEHLAEIMEEREEDALVEGLVGCNGRGLGAVLATV